MYRLWHNSNENVIIIFCYRTPSIISQNTRQNLRGDISETLHEIDNRDATQNVHKCSEK